tara:strand:+ start:103 stop:288 length:186 start_codon:yes stop_codon:yes gene_type:complete
MHILEERLLTLARELMEKDQKLGERLEILASISHEYYLSDPKADEQSRFDGYDSLYPRKNR